MGMLKKLKETWDEMHIHNQAKQFFTKDQIQILMSAWGQSRIEELEREKNSKRDLPLKIHVRSLRNIVNLHRVYEEYQNGLSEDFSIAANSYQHSKDMNEIVEKVLKEGAQKKSEDLKKSIALPPQWETVGDPALMAMNNFLGKYNQGLKEEHQIIIESEADFHYCLRLARKVKQEGLEVSMEKNPRSVIEKSVFVYNIFTRNIYESCLVALDGNEHSPER